MKRFIYYSAKLRIKAPTEWADEFSESLNNDINKIIVRHLNRLQIALNDLVYEEGQTITDPIIVELVD